MGLIPQSFLDELLSRTDIVSLVESHLPLKKSGSNFLGNCPFHQEKTPSFYVIAQKQFYHCFGCGASGNAISFIMQYLNQGFVDAVETLASHLGLTVPQSGPSQRKPARNLYTLLQEVNQWYQDMLKSPQGKIAQAYLHKRGLDAKVIEAYQIGYAPPGWHALEQQFKRYRQELLTTGMLTQNDKGHIYDRYRHRIIFPIHDRQGRIIGFGGRTIEDKGPKYLNSPETPLFHKSHEIYGLHQVIQNRKKGSILVVEGYLDVLALAQHGIMNPVATLGTAVNTHHIQILNKYTEHIIFAFDGDRAGGQAAWRALEHCLPLLETGLSVSFLLLPPEEDPDSMVRKEGCEAFEGRIAQAKSLDVFFLEAVSQGLKVETTSGKNQLLKRMKPHLAHMPDGPYKQCILEAVSQQTRIDPHRILQLMMGPKTLPERSIKPIARSPIRLAIALLLQNPHLFASCQALIAPEWLQSASEEKGHKVLKALLTHLSHAPSANTATLIEYWRGTPHFDTITQLAGWEHGVPAQALGKELQDILLFLQKQHLECTINQYILKSRKEGLSPAEQLTLQQLLQQRQGVKGGKSSKIVSEGTTEG